MVTKDKIVLWSILGAVAVLVLLNFTNLGTFSTLPAGQCNINSAGTFITNLEPMDGRYSQYGNSGIWISADINSDGVKEKFGYRSSISASGRYSGCRESSGAVPIQIDYNAAGDDIYTLSGYLYVCSDTGTNVRKFQQDYRAASNALITCDNGQGSGGTNGGNDGGTDGGSTGGTNECIPQGKILVSENPNINDLIDYARRWINS